MRSLWAAKLYLSPPKALLMAQKPRTPVAVGTSVREPPVTKKMGILSQGVPSPKIMPVGTLGLRLLPLLIMATVPLAPPSQGNPDLLVLYSPGMAAVSIWLMAGRSSKVPLRVLNVAFSIRLPPSPMGVPDRMDTLLSVPSP